MRLHGAEGHFKKKLWVSEGQSRRYIRSKGTEICKGATRTRLASEEDLTQAALKDLHLFSNLAALTPGQPFGTKTNWGDNIL